eukprot:CAMPEP_0172436434 /NCGR_PEP_ID=MMETSP1064-20121228/71719_1 /TAXON_ID=202472 /ORGANISM="Aulacoseira subarctica , Strain CCAP 1002/5" /LENGTH=528 /DNA_ID=CAMNT_0013184835 /DNA_START=340 /DNA_END=1926 /DNA_ORIENTATION=+
MSKCRTISEKAQEKQRHVQRENLWLNSGFYYGIGEEFLKSKEKTALATPKDNKKLDHYINNGRKVISVSPIEELDRESERETLQKRKMSHNHNAPCYEDDDDYYSLREEQQTPKIFAALFRETFHEFLKATDGIREDLSLLRQEIMELQKLQRRNLQQQQRQYGSESDDNDYEYRDSSAAISEKRRRVLMFDQLALQIENWAKRLLKEEGKEEYGWKVVECNKLLKGKYNADGSTKVFLKWMSDPREETELEPTKQQQLSADADQNNKSDKDVLFPCIKCYGTLDAPIETVCAYLADESRVSEYNDLIADFRDLEEITCNSKITWSLCPPILFIKSRDFVTFCSHRWKRDGTQVVVNQALEHHENAPEASEREGGGRACRARALRGANLISPDPDDPEKTRFTILALADPGGGLSQWTMKAAVNAVAPIEPFKLYYKLKRALKCYEPCSTEMVSTSSGTSATAGSGKPAGLSQLGYACFWPKGGLQEHHSHQKQTSNSDNIDKIHPAISRDEFERETSHLSYDSVFER